MSSEYASMDLWSLVHPFFFVYVCLNVVTYAVMLWDKIQSRRNGAERVSEVMIFFMATMFGGVGVFLGMLTLRHKIRKWYFLIGMPMLSLENLALFYVVDQWLR